MKPRLVPFSVVYNELTELARLYSVAIFPNRSDDEIKRFHDAVRKEFGSLNMVDRLSASVARQTCDNILRRIDEALSDKQDADAEGEEVAFFLPLTEREANILKTKLGLALSDGWDNTGDLRTLCDRIANELAALANRAEAVKAASAERLVGEHADQPPSVSETCPASSECNPNLGGGQCPAFDECNGSGVVPKGRRAGESVSGFCRRTQFQDCFQCDDFECCDNQNPKLNLERKAK